MPFKGLTHNYIGRNTRTKLCRINQYYVLVIGTKGPFSGPRYRTPQGVDPAPLKLKLHLLRFVVQQIEQVEFDLNNVVQVVVIKMSAIGSSIQGYIRHKAMHMCYPMGYERRIYRPLFGVGYVLPRNGQKT